VITAARSMSPLPRTTTRSRFQSARSSCSASEIRQPVRDEERDQGAIAELRLVKLGGWLRGHPLELVGLERLRSRRLTRTPTPQPPIDRDSQAGAPHWRSLSST
jgi:hypothetical protein